MRYSPSRRYLWLGLAAWPLATAAGWAALTMPLAIIPFSVLLALSAGFVLLGLRPAIETRDRHLLIGSRIVPWEEIRQIKRTRWTSPLVVQLTLSNRRKVTLVYTGSLNTGASLLRQICRSSRRATIDGQTYGEFWGELEPLAEAHRQPLPYRLLRPEDEAEVERLYQQLKAVGRIDSMSSSDEI
jgi:hypothetical protein